MGTVLLIIVLIALVGVLPTWPHSRGWGYGPVAITGLLVLIVLYLLLTRS